MLVWCELPNWSRFSQASAERGVHTLGTDGGDARVTIHPS